MKVKTIHKVNRVKVKHKGSHEAVLNLGKTYMFRVIVEPDDDRWYAYCPVLQKNGATTWGYSREEALKNIGEVVQMIVSELREEKVGIPDRPSKEVEVIFDSRVAVAV
ncbi:MAG TPA: type II toxin-antitoxin system HicB family antitoxin [Candidatus Paceibacterota bacterium]